MFGFLGKKKSTPRLQAQRRSSPELRPEKSDSSMQTWQWRLTLTRMVQIALICTILTLFALVAWSFRQYSNSLVTKIQVIATYAHVAPAPLQQIISKHVTGTFFDVNVAALRQELTAIPWVHEVYVRRKWPDTIAIKIDEQQPIAQWKNEALFGVDGTLFTPPKNSFPIGLPLLLGHEENISAIVTYYQKIEKILSSLHLKVKQLDLNEQGNWHMIMCEENKPDSNINVFFGGDNIVTKMQNFAAAYPKIVLNNPDKIIASIDLRYKNGIAVKWEGLEVKSE